MLYDKFNVIIMLVLCLCCVVFCIIKVILGFGFNKVIKCILVKVVKMDILFMFFFYIIYLVCCVVSVRSL